MKYINQSIKMWGLMVFFIFLGVSCKDDITRGVSQLYKLPSGKIKGDGFVSIAKGEAFTDLGVETTSAMAILCMNPEGNRTTIDKIGNEIGVYVLSYILKGTSPFFNDSVVVNRYIGVYDTDVPDDIPEKKFWRSFYGKEKQKSSAITVTWKNIVGQKGWYTTDNIGGVSGNASYVYPVYIFNYKLNKMTIPLQSNKLGGNIYVQGNKFDYDPSKSTTNDPKDAIYSYSVRGTGYGTSTRYFKKN